MSHTTQCPHCDEWVNPAECLAVGDDGSCHKCTECGRDMSEVYALKEKTGAEDVTPSGLKPVGEVTPLPSEYSDFAKVAKTHRRLCLCIVCRQAGWA